jgi:hypothetical protein
MSYGLCRYLSTSLGERGRCTSAEGRLISRQLEKWWLSRLCNLLGEALKAPICRGRLRQRGAVDVVHRRHDRPASRGGCVWSDGIHIVGLSLPRGVTTEASPSSPRQSSPENGCPPTMLQPPRRQSPEPTGTQSPVLQLAGSRRARRRAPPALGRPTPKAHARAQLQQQRVMARGSSVQQQRRHCCQSGRPTQPSRCPSPAYFGGASCRISWKVKEA